MPMCYTLNIYYYYICYCCFPKSMIYFLSMSLILYIFIHSFLSILQTLAIWDWTTNGEYPVASKELGVNYGQQTYVLFNPEDHSQIVSNSPTQVIFYKWVSTFQNEKKKLIHNTVELVWIRFCNLSWFVFPSHLNKRKTYFQSEIFNV